MTLQERQSEFVLLFNMLDSWADRFQYLIELGNELPDMPEHLRSPSNMITCLSRIYFQATVSDSKVHIEGWSNAATPSGLIAAIKQIFEGCTIEELRSTEITFHIETGLMDNMTEQRKASLKEMITRLKRL